MIQTEEDFIWAEENAKLVNKDCHLYLQPEWSQAEKMMQTITEYVMAHPKWKISIQSHKYMKIP